MEPMTSSKEERTWALASHLSAFAGHFFPLGNVLGPLVVWLIKKDEMPLVKDQAKEALNFQIAISLALLACAVMAFTVILAIVAIPLAIVIYLYAIVYTVIGAVKANEGVAFRYPVTLRLID